ncbi:MAG: elongation factor G [Defluviitaleaceae bacterium]|nr:elongation factor G [Defluviitaleaceae bacterium]
MKIYSASAIRNVVILGHSGTGKTTVAEAALNAAGITSRLGRVDDGNTVSDYDPEEIKRGVSISTSVIPIEWLNNKINFLDTPGYFDFVGEVKEALAAADIALIVVSAKSGVEVGTEKAWAFAEEAGIPRMIFVNGMDDENADLNKVIEDLQEHFGTSIAPMQVPIKEGGKFTGFVQVISGEGKKYAGGKPSDCPVPGDIADHVEKLRSTLVEAVAESDEDLMERFFNDEQFTAEEIEAALGNGVRECMVTPVYIGSATQGIGVRELMDGITSKAPAAAVCKTREAADLKTEEPIELKCDEAGPLAAFVFKTIADPYVGRLSIFRVVSGVIKKDTPLYNPRTDSNEKAGHLYVLRGKEQLEVAEVRAGDIGAIAKLQNTATQDTLCLESKQIEVKKIDFPEPLLSMAIIPKAKGDEDKIGQSVGKMLEEDKTLKFELNAETKQALVSGIGENQLDILVSKCKNRYKLDVELISPIVPYREMIKTHVRVQGRHKKQSGGRGQFGDVHMEFEPSGDLTQAYIFEEKIFGGSVPRQFFPAVEKGIQECVKAGPLAGYPVVGVKATLVDGSYHAVDSSEMAFKLATTIAFKDGFLKAKPTLLEPIALIDVWVPDNYTGDIMGDVSKRRGKILGQEKEGKLLKISAEVPMSELFKYATDLRSMTQGRGEFTLKFDRYEEAPGDVQQKVIEQRKKDAEKE